MVILGINYAFHDTSACLVRDGRLVSALEEERLSRYKHTQEFPLRSISRCLKESGLSLGSVDHVAVSINPSKRAYSKCAFAATLGRDIVHFVQYEFMRPFERYRQLMNWYNASWGASDIKPKLHFIDHHLAHVVGSYLVSSFDKAALLSMDGWGEWTSTWLGLADGTLVTHVQSTDFPHSLGCFYSAATEFCGFKPNYDEGKTMGLAPTGDPEQFYDIVKSMIQIESDGQVKLDLSFFDHPRCAGRFCSEKFHQTFGPPRHLGEPLDQRHGNLAASFQAVLEESIIDLCRVLERRTDADKLVLAGGVALNSVANGRIVESTRFSDVYVMPAAGDAGTSIGAAYYVNNLVLGNKSRAYHDNPFVGTSYTDEEIERILAECKVKYHRSDDVCRETALHLRRGGIVGWFQGGMEIGPRSLGNRSILADPTRAEMKDKINLEVKHREPFRPFAPAVIAEARSEFFELPVDSPFMLKVSRVKPAAKDRIPAVVHVDGTARMQTVHRSSNAKFHDLLTAFADLSGVPVLLNTSFNVAEEPIVESPEQALRCFFSTGLDVLVIGNYVVSKECQATR